MRGGGWPTYKVRERWECSLGHMLERRGEPNCRREEREAAHFQKRRREREAPGFLEERGPSL